MEGGRGRPGRERGTRQRERNKRFQSFQRALKDFKMPFLKDRDWM